MIYKENKGQKFFTHPLGIIVAALAATFLWGSAFPFIKLSYQALDIGTKDYFEQILFAGYRFLLASIMIFMFLYGLKGTIRYQRGTAKRIVTVGLFQTFLQYIFFYIGMSYCSGVQGSIIAGTTTFFQILIAHFVFNNDRLSTRKVIGMLIGFTGVIIVNITHSSESAFTFMSIFGIGELLLLLAMASGGLGNVLVKKYSGEVDILYLTAYQMLFGAICLLVIGGSQVGFLPFTFGINTIGMLLYLAALSAGGFVLWNYVMKYNPVGKVSMYLFFIPIFGVILSALLLRETLHLSVLTSLALVVIGILVVNKQTHVFGKND